MRKLVFVTATACVAAAASFAPQSGSIMFERVLRGPVVETHASTGGVSWIDVDGDGDQDLFVGNGYDVSRRPPVPQDNEFYENAGGIFRPIRSSVVADSMFSSGSAWADIDNDGDLDVFIPNQLGQDNYLYINHGGQFTRASRTQFVPSGGRSFAASWADADGDGFVDLYVSNGGLTGAERNEMYRNVGGTRLERLSDIAPVIDSTQTGGVVWVDFDNDGDVDLYVSGPLPVLYRNNGGFRFAPVGRDSFPVSAPNVAGAVSGAWGDYDNDGDQDLFIPYQLGEPGRLYVNNGGRLERAKNSATDLDAFYAPHAVWADLDNNGWLDLVVASWGGPTSVYMNERGTLTRRILGALGATNTFASSATTADYDGDGDLDILVGNWPNAPGDGELNLLLENKGPVGAYIMVDLRGVRSNRSAIGARVSVFARISGHVVQMTREVRSQDGWRSQNPLTLHFGLGNARRADSIMVRWPSGLTEVIRGVDANQRIAWEEGKTPSPTRQRGRGE